jgi:hypothetical protein
MQAATSVGTLPEIALLRVLRRLRVPQFTCANTVDARTQVRFDIPEIPLCLPVPGTCPESTIAKRVF